MGQLKNTVFAASLSLLAASPLAVAKLPQAVDGQALPSLAPMLERATPAVVSIAVLGEARGPMGRPAQGAGSGVVVDAEQGYILTNAHVVAKASEIRVSLASGEILEAELVGADPGTDIAVLKVDPEAATLKALPIGSSDQLKVGDFVVAVGNPFGLGQTATSGIVSALGRSGLHSDKYEDFIQTDASINPGNSGGALINLRGELVGINTAILAPSGGNVGIGFAVPTQMAQDVMQQLVEYGEVQRGLLGVQLQPLTPELAQALSLESHEGALIAAVVPGSAAAAAGLQPGDVVTAVNGEPISRANGLRTRVGLMRVGEKLELTLLRDGESRTIDATIGAPSGPQLAGALSPRLEGAEFGMIPGDAGERVGVVRVEPGSPAFRTGVREGDVILSVNRQAVDSLDELRTVAQGKGPLLLHVQRGEAAQFLIA